MIEIQPIATGKIKPSPTQPRTHFDPEKHQGLTESIRAHGFTLSALLVRPWPGELWPNHFEIIGGERRWRAAMEAEVAEVPCIVRHDLTDQQVLEMQLIDNIQHEGLTAIEEAVHYDRLLAMRDEKEAPLYTFETLAKRVGVNPKTVRNTHSLCRLGPEERKQVEAGTLPPRTAMLIASIPDEKARTLAAKKILHPQHETGPLSFRRAEEMIQHEFVRDLRGASFDQEDGELYPVEKNEASERVAGGACVDCPMKLGVAMAGEVAPQRYNTCLNPICFEKKQQLAWAHWQGEETDEALGRRATNEEESRRLYPHGNQLSVTSGLVDVMDRPDGNDLRPGLDAPGTWRQLVKGAKLAVTITRDRLGKAHELVNREQAIEAARTINKHDIFKTAETTRKTRRELGLTPPDDLAAEEKDEKKKQTLVTTWLDAPAVESELRAARKREEQSKELSRTENRLITLACLDEVKKAAKEKHAAALLRLVIDREIDASKGHEDFFQRHHLPIGSPVTKQTAKRPFAELAAILVEFVVTDGGFIYELDETDRAWLEAFGVDMKTVAKRVRAEIELAKALAARTAEIAALPSLADYEAAHSCDKIDKGKISGFVTLDGKQWVPTGSVSGGSMKHVEFDLAELIPAAQFKGAALTFREKYDKDSGESARNDPNGFYYGMKVSHRGKDYVLGKQRMVKVADKRPKKPAPTAKKKNRTAGPNGTVKPKTKPRPGLTARGRRNLAAAMKARWAARQRAKKTPAKA